MSWVADPEKEDSLVRRRGYGSRKYMCMVDYMSELKRNENWSRKFASSREYIEEWKEVECLPEFG